MPNYRFTFFDKFKKDYKEAKKKNPELDSDFKDFLDGFDHLAGDIVPSTAGARKIRFQKGNQGKSGGYRVYYYFAFEDRVYLLRMFSKNKKSDLSIKEKLEIAEIIEMIKTVTLP